MIYYLVFHGGPFDGHVQAFHSPPEHLAVQAYFPINAHSIPNLTHQIITGPRSAWTSIAIYELQFNEQGRASYRFRVSLAPVAWTVIQRQGIPYPWPTLPKGLIDENHYDIPPDILPPTQFPPH